MLELVSLLEEAAAKTSARILPGFVRSLQTDNYSCGAHCAYTILRYFGYPDTKKSVLLRLRNHDGLDEDQMRAFFRRKGLKPARLNRPNFRKLRKEIDAGFPVLISMDTDHWAVVCGYGKDCFYVMDPSIVRSLWVYHGIKRFRQRWDRQAMAIRA